MNEKRIKIANQTAAQTVPFVLLQASWVQLAPYGDFPHGKGLQRKDQFRDPWQCPSRLHTYQARLAPFRHPRILQRLATTVSTPDLSSFPSFSSLSPDPQTVPFPKHWRNQLEKDFDTKTAELANAKPVLKTGFTRQFSNTNNPVTSDATELTRKIQQLVQEKMKNSGIDYDRAWQQIKTENPALFAAPNRNPNPSPNHSPNPNLLPP